MYMTPEEILLIFREAKDKSKQIRILADLNLCHWSQIVEVLRAQGVKITYKPRTHPATRKKAAAS